MPLYLSDGKSGLLGQGKLSSRIETYLPNYYDLITQITDARLLTALFRDYGYLTSAYLFEDSYRNYLVTRDYTAAKDLLP